MATTLSRFKPKPMLGRDKDGRLPGAANVGAAIAQMMRDHAKGKEVKRPEQEPEDKPRKDRPRLSRFAAGARGFDRLGANSSGFDRVKKG